MKNLLLVLVLLLMQSCLRTHRVDVWKTISIEAGQKLVIQETKAPTSIEIKNQSNEPISISSNVKVPKNLNGQSEFSYRLPKKGTITLVNGNQNSVSVHLHYSSSKILVVNNKELQ